MENISNLHAKVLRTDVIGACRENCSGQYCGMMLGVFERVQPIKWSFRLTLQRLHNAVTPLENIMSTAKMLRILISSRKQMVTISYCHDCQNHQTTSWHMPGQFERVFQECQALLKEKMPSVIVIGKPVTNMVGAFEVHFMPFEGGSTQVLYSALQQQGWLPTPELVLSNVKQAVQDLHWNHSAITSKEKPGSSSIMRFSVRDSVTHITVRSARITIFTMDGIDDLEYASKCTKEFRTSKRDAPSSTMTPLADTVVVYSNARGRCEASLQEGSTYFLHVEAKGYYPIQVPMMKWSTTTPNATLSTQSAKQRNTTRIIAMMPRIEVVNISIVDLDTSAVIEAGGIETVLINRRTAVRHTTLSNNKGVSFLHIPHGMYRVDVTAPQFDQIPYALTSDKRAMSFMETATAFDKARRDAARKVKELKLNVNESMSCKFGIPSMRWPWHFTVVDGSTGLPLRGAKCSVFSSDGSEVFSGRSSKDGTAFGMIELGHSDMLRVEMTDSSKDAEVYLPFSCSLTNLQRKRSPLLMTITLCPKPKIGRARAVLCWNRRCWNDLHLRISSDDANSSFHVWKNNISAGGATHDLVSNNGLGPSSVNVQLLPNSTYTFQVVQYGSFQANESMHKISKCGLELLIFDHRGIVMREKYLPENNVSMHSQHGGSVDIDIDMESVVSFSSICTDENGKLLK
jgi:hypothetical protein